MIKTSSTREIVTNYLVSTVRFQLLSGESGRKHRGVEGGTGDMGDIVYCGENDGRQPTASCLKIVFRPGDR